MSMWVPMEVMVAAVLRGLQRCCPGQVGRAGHGGTDMWRGVRYAHARESITLHMEWGLGHSVHSRPLERKASIPIPIPQNNLETHANTSCTCIAVHIRQWGAARRVDLGYQHREGSTST